MKVTRMIHAEDLTKGDFLFDGEVVKVTDNYEDVDSVDVYVEGEDEPLTFKSDDFVEIYFDVA